MNPRKEVAFNTFYRLPGIERIDVFYPEIYYGKLYDVNITNQIDIYTKDVEPIIV